MSERNRFAMMSSSPSTASQVGSPADYPIPSRVSRERILLRTVLAALVAVAVWSVWEIRLNPATVLHSLTNAVDFIGRFFPLDFPSLQAVLGATVTTLAIVFLATVLSVVLGFPLAVLAASNTTTGNGPRLISRGLLVVLRAIPDLILAIVFFRVFGPGSLTGVLALGIGSTGMVGKLFADAIEQVDSHPAEGLRAVGARRGHIVAAAIIRQLLPQVIATALHRFDINLRISVILGYVGVSGIGMELSQALNIRDYSSGMAWALVMLLLCLITELISGSARAVLLGENAAKATGFYAVFRKLIDRRHPNTPVPCLIGKQVSSGYQVPVTSDGRIRISPGWSAERVRRTLGMATLLGLLALAAASADLFANNPFSRLATIPHTLGLFFPPSDAGVGATLWLAMLQTIQIGLAATLIGAVLAFPIGVLAAGNVTGNRHIQYFFRGVIVFIRAIPDLILAIVLIVVTGLGPAAGVLALAFSSVGMLSKLLADSIEETDTAIQVAQRANGATRSQVFFSATLRQALPSFVAHLIYQLDMNFRSATMLGIVGAGGIGFYLLSAARILEFDAVTYMLLMIIVVTLLLEGLSMWARRLIR